SLPPLLPCGERWASPPAHSARKKGHRRQRCSLTGSPSASNQPLSWSDLLIYRGVFEIPRKLLLSWNSQTHFLKVVGNDLWRTRNRLQQERRGRSRLLPGCPRLH